MSHVPGQGNYLDWAQLTQEFNGNFGSNWDINTLYTRYRNSHNQGGSFSYPGYPGPGNSAMGGVFANQARWFSNASGYPGLRGGNSQTGNGQLAGGGWTQWEYGFVDDGFTYVPFPSGFGPWYVAGNAYYGCYVGSNGYITFGNGSSTYSGISSTNPPYPKIRFFGMDGQYSGVFSVPGWTGYGGANDGLNGFGGAYYGNQGFVIRWEGSTSYGSGVNCICEFTFFDNYNFGFGPYNVVEIKYGPWTGGGTGQVDNGGGTTYSNTWSPSAYNSFLVYTNSNGTGSVGVYSPYYISGGY